MSTLDSFMPLSGEDHLSASYIVSIASGLVSIQLFWQVDLLFFYNNSLAQ